MKIGKIKLEILYLSSIYFLLLGFGVLFVVNLILRSLVWPFFQNTIVISSINLLLSSLVLWLAIKFFAPIFKLRIKDNNTKHFLIISSSLMLFAVVITNFYLYFSLTATAMIVQLVNSVVLLGFFSFFSYNYIAKESNN